LPATAPFVRRTYQYASAVAGGRLAAGPFFAVSHFIVMRILVKNDVITILKNSL
jgi:hypothetical protein